jgi:hypothetical protein
MEIRTWYITGLPCSIHSAVTACLVIVQTPLQCLSVQLLHSAVTACLVIVQTPLQCLSVQLLQEIRLKD